jgi:hypothetical protein
MELSKSEVNDKVRSVFLYGIDNKYFRGDICGDKSE